MIRFRMTVNGVDTFGISLSPEELKTLKDTDAIAIRDKDTGWGIDLVVCVAEDEGLAFELESKGIECERVHYVVHQGDYGKKQ